jgi:hypothetical protein
MVGGRDNRTDSSISQGGIDSAAVLPGARMEAHNWTPWKGRIRRIADEIIEVREGE